MVIGIMGLIESRGGGGVGRKRKKGGGGEEDLEEQQEKKEEKDGEGDYEFDGRRTEEREGEGMEKEDEEASGERIVSVMEEVVKDRLHTGSGCCCYWYCSCYLNLCTLCLTDGAAARKQEFQKGRGQFSAHNVLILLC